MTLRIMLVGLVASLGFELPSGSDVFCWVKSSQSWVQSRMIDLSGPVSVEPELDRPELADCRQVVEKPEVLTSVVDKELDSAFEKVTESIAADLSADLLANHREEAPAEPVIARVETVEPAPVVVTEVEDAGCLVVVADEAKPVEVTSTTDETISVEPIDPVVDVTPAPKLDRLSAAVRLTREAVQAWADVMQEAAGQ